MNDTIRSPQGIHLMGKPVGPICNLDCHYCFYLEKENLFPERHRFLMSDEVLRAYIERNIQAEPSPEVLFTWQGGEPMLRGLSFFKQAVAYQRKFSGDKAVRNALQTNGVLLDDEWCRFLAEADFLVGISLDGPKEIHDQARVDKQGRPTFDAVMRGIELLKKYKIPFNVLVTVSSTVASYPKQVYEFLKANGVTHVQFNPVVERAPASTDQALGLTFATPPKTGGGGLANSSLAVTPHSVGPAAYGDFLIAVFDDWVKTDVGAIHVMNFEWALAAWCQLPSTICLFEKDCGRSLIVEHNGDVYSCDHFMYPDYLVGNVLRTDPMEMANSPPQVAFGNAKSRTLPKYCQECDYLFACNGECPKNRFSITPKGEPGLNYLCPSYKRYFKHITKYMNAMAKLLSHDQPVSLIMDAIKGPLVVKLK